MAYNVYQGDDLIAENIEDKEYTVEGLTPNTEYSFSVSEVKGDKESEKATVTVTTDPVTVTGVTLAPNNMTAVSGTASNRQLTPTITPANATNKAVTYSVTPVTTGLTVNASGVLAWTAAVPAGTYTVTVTTTDGSYTDTSTLVLSEPVINVTGVTIAPKTVTLEIGETQQLTATVAPANATDKSVTYASKAQGIASVDDKGLVTARVAGEAEIVVSTVDGDRKDTCVVTVAEPEPEPEPEE